MAITDPQVIRFVNERSRPRAEQIRNLFAAMADDKKKWDEISGLVPNDSKESLDDGRDAEGVSRLNGEDANTFAAVCEKISASVSELADVPVIHKFCVRPLLQE